MGKQSCWFGWFKRLFLCNKQSQITDNEKAKKWRWFSIQEREIEEANEKQRKYAVRVAIATAAAAEAAVAAAHAAAEIVRLTAGNASQPLLIYSSADQQHLAAVRIQSAFRRYLGRKALGGLKGVVRLQALIRGQTVRRRFMHIKLSTASIFHNFYPSHCSQLQSKSQRRWDYSMLCTEDTETLLSRRNDANLKRDRIMKYSFSHRERRNNLMMVESLPKRPETARHRQSQCLQQPTTNTATPDLFGTLQVRTRSGRKQDAIEGLHSPVSCPRRSFSRTHRANTGADEICVPSSPVFPTYMAATESARAKARSISTPRQRIGALDFSTENKNRRFSLCASYDRDGFGSYGVDEVSQFSPYSYKLKSPFLG